MRIARIQNNIVINVEVHNTLPKDTAEFKFLESNGVYEIGVRINDKNEVISEAVE
jgi:hypothetical protein